MPGGIKITSDRNLVDEKTILVQHNNEIGFNLDDEGNVIGGPVVPTIGETERLKYKQLKAKESELNIEIELSSVESETLKLSRKLSRVMKEMDTIVQNVNRDSGDGLWYNVSKKALLHIAGHTHYSLVVGTYLSLAFYFGMARMVHNHY